MSTRPITDQIKQNLVENQTETGGLLRSIVPNSSLLQTVIFRCPLKLLRSSLVLVTLLRRVRLVKPEILVRLGRFVRPERLWGPFRLARHVLAERLERPFILVRHVRHVAVLILGVQWRSHLVTPVSSRLHWSERGERVLIWLESDWCWVVHMLPVTGLDSRQADCRPQSGRDWEEPNNTVGCWCKYVGNAL